MKKEEYNEKKAKDRFDKIFKDFICPDCGEKLIDNRIKDGKYKGHGRIICPKCQQFKAII